MSFTAHDLRYATDQTVPQLYAYLHRHAQSHLGSLKFDATEVDIVVGHTIDQLVRFGLLGFADTTPPCALDMLTNEQFYSFLKQMVKNKAIDRLRKKRLPVRSTTELEDAGTSENENPLGQAVESMWGVRPFDSPEEIAISAVTQRDLRNVLKHCILALRAAPHQLEAVVQELRALGAGELLHDLGLDIPLSGTEPVLHLSQQKDHAHKKLRNCLQSHSTHLVVTLALRLTEYATQSTPSSDYMVTCETLVQNNLSEEDVRHGLHQLEQEGFISWNGEETVRLSKEQVKQLTRYYRVE